MPERHDFDDLLARNRAWAERVRAEDPGFFDQLSRQQSPRFLWIGCSDSRVPATEIVDLLPGEMFVHRNIANQVIHTDLNCLSVIQFAVDVLKVEHIIVCGHYGCGGVQAALKRTRLGLCDIWLRHIQDLAARHRADLPTDEARAADRLAEWNVIEQVANVCRTLVVRDAWSRGQALQVHGWVYGVGDGLIKNLGLSIADAASVEPACERAMAHL
ncbi:MAG: carbonate dehydratase [Gammaproteobacteria bacterium]